VLTLASVKARSTVLKADALGPWRRHGGPGRRGREDDNVPPTGAARYGGEDLLGAARHSVGVWSSGCRGNGASGSATQTWRPAAAPGRRLEAPRRWRRGLTSCLLWLAAQQEENPKGALGQGCGGECPEVLNFPSTSSSLLLFPSCGEQGEISRGRRRKEGERLQMDL
jgi:hypothetical protein